MQQIIFISHTIRHTQLPSYCSSFSMLRKSNGILPCDRNNGIFGFVFEQEADESLNFEEQILEAAKSIAAATSALVKAASAAQRELVAQGKVRVLLIY